MEHQAETSLRRLVFPPLGRAWFIGICILLGITIISFVLMSIGFGLLYRRSRLLWIKQDGSFTRPHAKFIVPLAWLLTSILVMLYCTFQIRDSLYNRRSAISGFLQVFSFAPLALGYFTITLSSLCSLPHIRKWARHREHLDDNGSMSKFPQLVLGTYSFLLLGAIGTILFPAVNLAKQFQEVEDIVLVALEDIQSGEQFANLLAISETLANIAAEALSTNREAGFVYFSWIIAYFIFGLTPSVLLAKSLRQEIKKLEAQTVLDVATPSDVILVELNDPTFLTSLPKPKRNAPFSNLQRTSLHPKRIQELMDGNGVGVSERASAMRSLLKQHIISTVYFAGALICAMSLTIYLISPLPSRSPTRTVLITTSLWSIAQFLITAIPLSVIFLRFALQPYPNHREEIPLSISGGPRGAALPVKVEQHQVVTSDDVYMLKRDSMGEK